MPNNALPKKLLWVDDDRDLLDHQRTLLTEAGFDVSVEDSVDGASTAISIAQPMYDLIMIDLMLSPGTLLRDKNHRGGLMTGVRFAEWLLKECPHSNAIAPTNLFIFTNRVSADAKREAAGIGVQYFQKFEFKGKRLRGLIDEFLKS